MILMLFMVPLLLEQPQMDVQDLKVTLGTFSHVHSQPKLKETPLNFEIAVQTIECDEQLYLMHTEEKCEGHSLRI